MENWAEGEETQQSEVCTRASDVSEARQERTSLRGVDVFAGIAKSLLDGSDLEAESDKDSGRGDPEFEELLR